MTYFNNPYTQQAYQGQMIQPSMAAGTNQFGYNQQMYPSQPMQQMYGQQTQTVPQRIDFQGVVVSSFDDVKTYPVPLGGTANNVVAASNVKSGGSK